MYLRLPDADVCQMCESIAHFNTRDVRDKRLHAHAARTEHVP
jgi:hypothetical protein